MTRKFRTWPIRSAVALLALVALCACGPRSVRGDVDRPPLTIEQLLALSLEGPDGLALAARTLNQRDTRWKTLSTGETVSAPIVLEDGVSLHSVWLTPSLRSYDLMVDVVPCLRTNRIAAITGAGPGQPRISAHLEDLGLEFQAQRNGIDVSFVSQPSAINCVRAIYVRQQRNVR